jgi:Sulfotransferase domain
MKVFEIGFGRTGTSSLTAAAECLGYHVLHWGAPHHAEMLKELFDGRLYSCIAGYDFISDCVAPIFHEVDTAFPGSKFILSVRDELQWLRSFAHHTKVTQQQPQMDFRTFYRIQRFGCFSFEHNQARLLKSYRDHTLAVQSYFRDRPADLLTINVCAGEGWEKLCRFLDKPIPSIPFPHRNKTERYEP